MIAKSAGTRMVPLPAPFAGRTRPLRPASFLVPRTFPNWSSRSSVAGTAGSCEPIPGPLRINCMMYTNLGTTTPRSRHLGWRSPISLSSNEFEHIFAPRVVHHHFARGGAGFVGAVFSAMFRRRFGYAPKGLQPGALLDVGCGDGTFLLEAQKAGWNVCGLETSETAVKNAKALGLSVLPGSLEDRLFDDSQFNLVRMWSVLEHVPDANVALRELVRILKPGGWAIIQVPNAASFAQRLTQARWSGWDLPAHLTHFIPKLCAGRSLGPASSRSNSTRLRLGPSPTTIPGHPAPSAVQPCSLWTSFWTSSAEAIASSCSPGVADLTIPTPDPSTTRPAGSDQSVNMETASGRSVRNLDGSDLKSTSPACRAFSALRAPARSAGRLPSEKQISASTGRHPWLKSVPGRIVVFAPKPLDGKATEEG